MQTPEKVFTNQSLKQELGRCPHYLVDQILQRTFVNIFGDITKEQVLLNS